MEGGIGADAVIAFAGKPVVGVHFLAFRDSGFGLCVIL
jgi:hypothetical protein